MSTDAGTVYASIKIQLDELQDEIKKAENLFVELGNKVDGIKPEIRLKLGKLKLDIQKAELELQKLKQVAEKDLTQEMRLKIDKLQLDIANYNNEIKKVTKTANDTAKNASKAFENMSKSGINQFAKMAKGIQAAFMALPIIGLIAAIVGGITKLVNSVNERIKEAREAYKLHNQELAKMGAVLQSTGAIAWTTTHELRKQAIALRDTSTYALNDIMKMQSVLLGFRSITGSVFERTTKAIVDMSSVMGGDLVGAANSVGKAIDTPVQGMGALSKQGFVFTDSQKKLVKELDASGKHFEAQQIILQEVEDAFLGAAAAMSSVLNIDAKVAASAERLKIAEGALNQSLGDSWKRATIMENTARAHFKELEYLENARKNGTDIAQNEKESLEKLNKKTTDVTDNYDKLVLLGKKAGLELSINIKEAEQNMAKLGIELYDLMPADGWFKTATEKDNHKKYLEEIFEITDVEEAVAKARKIHSRKNADERERVVRAIFREKDAIAQWEKEHKKEADERAIVLNKLQAENDLRDELNEIMKAGIDTTSALAVAEEDARKISSDWAAEREVLLNSFEAGEMSLEDFNEQYNKLSDNLTEATNATKKYKESIDNLEGSETDIYKATRISLEELQRLKDIDAIDDQKYAQGKLQAYQTQMNALNSLITKIKELKTEEGTKAWSQQQALLTQFNNQLVIAAANVEKLSDEIKTVGKDKTLSEEFHSQIDAITKVRDKAIRGANDLIQQNLLGEEADAKLKLDIIAAEETAYNALLSLWKQHGYLARDNPEAWKKLEAAIKQAMPVMEKAMREQQEIAKAAWDKDIDRDIARANAERISDLETIRKIEKQIALEKLQQTQVYKDADADAKTAMENKLEELRTAQAGVGLVQMLGDYQQKKNELTKTSIQLLRIERQAALEAAKEFSDMGDQYDKLIQDINDYYKELEKREAWDKFTSNAQQAVSQISQLFNSIADTVLNMNRIRLDDWIETNEKKHEDLQENLDKELQARLFTAGLISAETEKQYEAELQKAIATGNHRLIYEAEQAKKRFDIEKDVQDKKEQAEKEFLKAKAEEEFKYNLATWEIEKTKAYTSIAQGILTAMASAPFPWNLIPMGFATGIGIANRVKIEQNKPVLKYAEGGIVPGNPYRGDVQPLLATGKEIMVPENLQENLWNMMKTGTAGGQPIHITTVIELDGQKIAENTFQHGSSGNAFIRSRGVVR